MSFHLEDFSRALKCPGDNGVLGIITFNVLRPIEMRLEAILCYCLSDAHGYGNSLAGIVVSNLRADHKTNLESWASYNHQL